MSKDENGNKEPNYEEFFKQLKPEWFIIEDYKYHPTIKAPLSN